MAPDWAWDSRPRPSRPTAGRPARPRPPVSSRDEYPAPSSLLRSFGAPLVAVAVVGVLVLLATVPLQHRVASRVETSYKSYCPSSWSATPQACPSFNFTPKAAVTLSWSVQNDTPVNVSIEATSLYPPFAGDVPSNAARAATGSNPGCAGVGVSGTCVFEGGWYEYQMEVHTVPADNYTVVVNLVFTYSTPFW